MQIKFIVIALLGIFSFDVCSKQAKQTFTLVIDPAGDTQYHGRIIGNQFERNLTLECAEFLKKELNAIFPELRIVLTRFPGETPTPFKNASFANKIGSNLFISLMLYQQQETRTVAIYLFGTQDTYQPSASTPLHFTPLYKVHQPSAARSKHYAQQLYDQLAVTLKKTGIVRAPLAVAFAPLEGIACPAFALELSVKNKHDALSMTSELVNALKDVIDQALTTQDHA